MTCHIHPSAPSCLETGLNQLLILLRKTSAAVGSCPAGHLLILWAEEACAQHSMGPDVREQPTGIGSLLPSSGF